jgi:hypothetical protein
MKSSHVVLDWDLALGSSDLHRANLVPHVKTLHSILPMATATSMNLFIHTTSEANNCGPCHNTALYLCSQDSSLLFRSKVSRGRITGIDGKMLRFYTTSTYSPRTHFTTLPNMCKEREQYMASRISRQFEEALMENKAKTTQET